MKENLLILWSSKDKNIAKNFTLLYSSVLLERNYWKTAHLMIWGPSIKLVKKSKKVRKKLIEIQKSGVTMSACTVCVDEYKVKELFEKLNIEITHTGEFLTKALKDESFSVLTV